MASATWMRWSAIAASTLSLATFATWMVHGAVPFELLEPARATPLSEIFARTAARSPEAGRAILYLAGTTAAAAALLSLALVMRGAALEAARHLGNSMGWAAFSLTYLFFVSAAAPFVSRLPGSLALLMACDFAAFLTLAFATRAFIQFWLLYPRPIAAEERAAFGTAEQSRELREMTSGMRWLVDRLFRNLIRSEEYRHKDEARQLRFYRFVTGNRMLYVSIALAVVAVPFWRATAFIPPSQELLLGISWEVGVLALLLPAMVCVPFVGLSIKLHRTLGSSHERKCVEWVRAGLMINLVAIVLMQPLTLLVLLVLMLIPQLATEWHLISILGWCAFLALGTAPLIFIVSLAASILYRGTLDPRLIVGRFTLWSALGVLLTFIFVLIERAVAMKLVEWFDLPPQTGLIAAGAAVAATFQPIRKFTEKWAAAWTARLMPTSMLAGGTRHEGAVTVVDISGYTALSAKDEQSALLASALVQKEARRVADAHEGRFVKSTGDGAILWFHTADEAMRALRELHDAVVRGAAALSLADLKLHSGLHWGEFVEARDGDIYGQTVNIAARIADRAKAGEIATSAAFAAKLTLSDLSMKSIGPQRFKNVPETIECHLLAAG